jgi:CRP/FNR family transcriptional regulator
MVFAEAGLERLLAAGEVLFRAGERKTHVYRVTKGLLGSVTQGAARSAVSFSTVGDVIGLGGLDSHAVTVEALGETVVQCLPRSALDEILNSDDVVSLKHADATELELSLLRDRLTEEGRANARIRVASLLSVLAATNGYEGRNRDVISDDITCGFVSEQLGLEVDTLQQTLLDLNRLGIITPLPGGALRITDRAGLERIAEG